LIVRARTGQAPCAVGKNHRGRGPHRSKRPARISMNLRQNSWVRSKFRWP